MDLDRIAPGQAFHDLDGVDWRTEPHDDRAVLDALHPDPGTPRGAEAG
jgi:hypothetical protein